MKKIILGSIIFYSCHNQPQNIVAIPINKDSVAFKDSLNKREDSLVKEGLRKMNARETAEKVGAQWNYSQDEDKITSKIIYYASVVANEKLDLKFPYDGGVTPTLWVRYMDRTSEVVLQLSKGQFMASSVDGEDIRVRFDNTKAVTYNCVGPSDGNSEKLFIESSGRFISMLKKAKTVIIRVVLFDNGPQDMVFNVEGFKWNH